MALRIESRPVGDVLVVQCHGRIVNGSEVNALHAYFGDTRSKYADVVMQLNQVEFIDSSGLGALVRLMHTSRTKHGDLKLCGAPESVRKVLQMTNLLTLFELYDSLEEAITAAYLGSRYSKGKEGDTRPRVLCLVDSGDVRALIREVLFSAGYNAVVTAKVEDAKILLKAMKAEDGGSVGSRRIGRQPRDTAGAARNRSSDHVRRSRREPCGTGSGRSDAEAAGEFRQGMISRREFVILAAAAAAIGPNLFAAEKVPTMLDHLLLGCSDLDEGIAFVEKHTGVRAAVGGVHPGRGTRNALLALGPLHYLEIIAPDPAQTEVPKMRAELPAMLKKLTSPTLVDWAVHTSDIVGVAERWRKAGLAFSGTDSGVARASRRQDAALANAQRGRRPQGTDSVLHPVGCRDGASVGRCSQRLHTGELRSGHSRAAGDCG